jgi:quercetin dioxygenase-like cupin family protein
MQMFDSLEDAIKTLTTMDEDYIFVRHTLQAGEEIPPHYHETANEWIVMSNGAFRVSLGEDVRYIDLRNKNRVVVIHFPKKTVHSFTADTYVTYMVFRDCKDETIYLERQSG